LDVSQPLKYRRAAPNDIPLLAELNHQLIRDEGHNNPMTVAELEERMRGWLNADYTAIVFEDHAEVIAYALFREQPDEVYLRHLFVVRYRRRQNIGRCAMRLLLAEVWPAGKRLTVSVLITNTGAVAFWRAVGYSDYCLTLEMLPGDKRSF
jgi:ribosomal protein S18 acetylase RimI-like enzyme